MRVNISLSEYWISQMRNSAKDEGVGLSAFVKNLYEYVYETNYGLTEEEFKTFKKMAEKENRDIKSMISHLLKINIKKAHYIKQFL